MNEPVSRELSQSEEEYRSIVNWTLISVALSLTCTDSGLCTLHKNNLKQKRSSKVTWASRRFPFILRYHCFPEQANFTVSAFNLVCVKIPLCNGACYDKSDGTCLRLNEVPNELIFREFLLIVHRLDFEYKIFISELRTRLRAVYHLITESSYM